MFCRYKLRVNHFKINNTMTKNYKSFFFFFLFLATIGYSQTYNYSHTIGVTGVSGSDNAHFNQLYGVDFDSSGKIYVADNNNKRIQVFNSDGTYNSTFNSGAGNLRIDFVADIVIDDSDNIYTVNDNFQELHKFNSSFGYITKISHNGITGLANDGTVTYAANYRDHYIIKFNSSLGVANTYGSSGNGTYQLNVPTGIEVDASGNMYVADRDNDRVQIYDASFNYIATLGVTNVSGSDNSHFNRPNAVAVDPIDGTILVMDSNNRRVQVFDASFNYVTTIAGNGSGTGNDQLLGGSNMDVDVDGSGNVYISDNLNHRVQVFTKNVLGVDDVSLKSSVSFYPNPAQETLNFKTTFNTSFISISNILGQRVFEAKEQSNNFSLDISVLTQGLYFVEIKNEHGTKVSRKFIKN